MPQKDLIEMKQAGLKSILIYAVQCQQTDIVRWLVEEKKADVNFICGRETALQRAIFCNNEVIMKLLLSYGADTDYVIPDSPWSLSLYSIIRGKFNLLELMLQAGAKLDYGT